MKSVLRRSPFVIAILGLLLIAIAKDPVQAADELAKEQVVVLALISGDIGTIDPIGSDLGQDNPVRHHIYGALVRYPMGDSASSEFQPDLATKWEVSPDKLTWTFHLRRGVKWHWGYGEVTSEDVVYSLNRVKNSNRSVWRSNYDNFKEIKAIDKYRVQIATFKQDAYFLTKVANYMGGFIFCKKAVERGEASDRGISPMKEEAVGTGPFKFFEYKPKDRITLVRNDDYWEGKPIIERVIFRYIPDIGAQEIGILKGEIHGMKGLDDAKWLKHMKSEGLVAERSGMPDLKTLYFNLKLKPFDDKRVREAFAYATSQEAIMMMQGEDISGYATSPVPAGLEGHINAGWKYKRDPEKAKQLLADAGYKNGLTVKLFMSVGPWLLDKMVIWQSELKDCGINLEMKQVDHTVYKNKIKDGTNPISMWGARCPTAAFWLRDRYHSSSIIPAANNFMYYSNPEVDRLIELAETSLDKNARLDALAKTQRRIVQDLPAIGVIETWSPNIRVPWLYLGYELKNNFLWNYEIGLKTMILKR